MTKLQKTKSYIIWKRLVTIATKTSKKSGTIEGLPGLKNLKVLWKLLRDQKEHLIIYLPKDHNLLDDLWEPLKGPQPKIKKIKSVFVIPGVVLVCLTCRNDSNAKRAGEQSFIRTVWIHTAVDLCPPDQAMHHLTEHTITSDTHHPEPGSKPKVSIAWAFNRITYLCCYCQM